MDENENNLKIKFPWYKNIFFCFTPRYIYRRFIRRQKYYNREFDDIMSIFGGKRIDLLPSTEDAWRGFRLIIDRKTELEFVQEDDHFVFSCQGKSLKDFPAGKVTIFDNIEKDEE